jgi:hypothetical protein
MDQHEDKDQQFAELPPAYSALEPEPTAEDFALSPNTMEFLNEFLKSNPDIQFHNGEWVLPDPAVIPAQACIDPNLLSK